MVGGLHQEGQTVESIVGGGTLGILVGTGSVEGGFVVTAADGDMGVGVDSGLERILVTVGIGFHGTHGAVEEFYLLTLESGERSTP